MPRLLDQPERNAARHAGQRLVRREIDQRLKQRPMCAVSQAARRVLDQLARRAGELLVGEDDEARLQRVVAGDEPRDRLALPAQMAVEREHDLAVAGARRAARRDR